jgi:hypothetical protein
MNDLARAACYLAATGLLLLACLALAAAALAGPW